MGTSYYFFHENCSRAGQRVTESELANYGIPPWAGDGSDHETADIFCAYAGADSEVITQALEDLAYYGKPGRSFFRWKIARNMLSHLDAMPTD